MVFPFADSLPETLIYLIVSAIIVAKIGAAGFVLVKAGRSPIWALILLLPFVEVVAVWVFAFSRWPRAAPGTT
ncbi:MAG: hypothetical protein RLO50_07820 [Azospirillaceae bacterium]